MNKRKAPDLLQLLLLSLAMSVLASHSFAAVPGTVGLEGRLQSQAGGPIADGPYDLTFSLYADASAKTASWTETAKVQVSGGRFAHALGSVKALSDVDAKTASWLGVTVGKDPELPRVALRSVAFAKRAGVADTALSAKSADSAKTAETAKAAETAKTADSAKTAATATKALNADKATVASDLSCTGCVSVSEMKFDGDVDLAGNSLKVKNLTATGAVVAGTVTANSFVGDGAKLSGVKVAGGSCKSGEVVVGVKPDGSVTCAKGGGGGDLLGGKVSDTFVEQAKVATLPVAIPDNTGATASVQASYGKVGVANSLTVKVALSNTDLSTVQIKLLPPDDKKVGLTLCDPCGKKDEKSYSETFTESSTLKVGSLKTFIGKSLEGIWTLQVLDSSYCLAQVAANKGICDVNNKADGKVSAFDVSATVTSAQSVKFAGTLQYALYAKAPFACEPSRTGHAYFDTTKGLLTFCDGKVWLTAGHKCGDGQVDFGEECDDGNTVEGDGCDNACKFDVGKTKAGAALSCVDVQAKVKDAPSGVYWIDPDGGDTVNAFQVWCDTKAIDGPWTLVMSLSKTSPWGYDHSVWTATDGGAGQTPDPSKNKDAVSPAFYKQQVTGTRMCMRRYDDGGWVCETITHGKNTARNLANGSAPPSSQGTNTLLTPKWKSLVAGGVWGAWAWHRFGWGALKTLGCGGIRLGFSADNDSSDSRDAGIGFGLLTQVACKGGTQRGAGYWQYPWSPQPNPAEASLEGQIWVK